LTNADEIVSRCGIALFERCIDSTGNLKNAKRIDAHRQRVGSVVAATGVPDAREQRLYR
jgi:hypothetical protein